MLRSGALWTAALCATAGGLGLMLLPNASGPAIPGFDKVFHFAWALLVALLLAGAIPRERRWMGPAAAVLLSLAVEGVQTGIPGRTPDAADAAAGAAGAVAAAVLARWVLRLPDSTGSRKKSAEEGIRTPEG